jgi:pyruvate, water dikinase
MDHFRPNPELSGYRTPLKNIYLRPSATDNGVGAGIGCSCNSIQVKKRFGLVRAGIRRPTLQSDSLIYWFEELGTEHNDVVGKKCANLGEMVRLGLAVPPGFALAIELYRKFLSETGTGEEMSHYFLKMGELKGKSIAEYDEMSRVLQQMIIDKEMPRTIQSDIGEYYDRLCEKTGIDDVAVSVRSAGTESRPGMFESFLNIRGKGSVFGMVKKVWASAYTSRAIAFRANKGFDPLGDELGVAIPKMVNAKASGIGFTVNPITGDDTKILIEANWGLGEGVVSGSESVDSFVVDKQTLTVVQKNVGNKKRYMTYKDAGTGWEHVIQEKQTIPCLSDMEIQKIAGILLSMEKRLGCAQDVEWAIDTDYKFPDNIFHLQTRPAKIQLKKTLSTTDQIVDLISKRFQSFT